MVFLEALRQFQFRVGRENCMFVHLSLVPVLGSVGEQKTKPTQHSVQELRKVGLSPDVIVCRSTELVDESTRRKISIFCHVAPDHVLSVHDVSNIYHVPLLLAEQNLHAIIKRRLVLDKMGEPELAEWKLLAETVDKLDTAPVVRIAIVGKYTGLQDSYLSVIKSLQHSAIQLDRKLQLRWIEATDVEEQTKLEAPEKYNTAWEILRNVDGIVVPGGFGSRGVEGKILTARFARENKVPILGVCLGFQVMVIEAARHLLSWEGAHSTEINEEANPACIVFMPEVSKTHMGGTMRLGARATVIRPTLGNGEPSIAADVYGKVDKVMERHRHRYEVNPELIDQLETSGLCFTGKDETGQRMEIAELPRSQHPYYLGVQFHPEFKSRPRRPSPPFFGLVAVASGQPERIGEAASTILSSGASPPASPTKELLEAAHNV
jgi:CTP synthase